MRENEEMNSETVQDNSGYDSLAYSDSSDDINQIIGDYGEEAYEGYEDDADYGDEYYDEYYDGDYEDGEYPDDEYYDEYEDDYEEGSEEQKSRSIWRTIIYMAVVLVFAIGLAVVMWFAADDVLALTKPDNEVTIKIEEGDTLEDVAQNLADHGLVNYKHLFILYGKFSHAESKFSTGTFTLNQLFDYHALVNGLAASSETRATVTLTFTEGATVKQIFESLDTAGVCSIDDLEEAASNFEFEYDFLSEIPYGQYNRLEGYLFPDTYDFYVDDDPVRVLNKLLSNFDSKFTEEMLLAIDELNVRLRAAMEKEGSFTEEEIENAMMTPYKIITVASLIEKEAGADSERPTIASVIYNRLTTRVHELLQIDATVEYALGEHKTELTANDLAVDNPYNTYKKKGLPPGPIANPGLSSIMAAIYPEDTTYYFYVLNKTGIHSFFDTYMEQQDFINGVEPEEEEPEETSAEDISGDVPAEEGYEAANGEDETDAE